MQQTVFNKVVSRNACQLIDENHKVSDVNESFRYCGKTFLSGTSQPVHTIMNIDIDNACVDNTSTGFDVTTFKQPLPLSGNINCSPCPSTFSNHDLYQYKDESHIEQTCFKSIEKTTKNAKSHCFRHSKKTKKSQLTIKDYPHDKDSNEISMNENCLIDVGNGFLKDIAGVKEVASDMHRKHLCHRESPLKYIEDVRKVALPSTSCDETILHSDSQEIVVNDIENVDVETDDTLVIITISENQQNQDGEGSLEAGCSNVQLTSNPSCKYPESSLGGECSTAVHSTNNSPSFRYPIALKDCFLQCLKFIQAGCTCERENLISQENKTKINSCPTCCSEVSCFLCSDTFSCYHLKNHMMKNHAVKINNNMLSNPDSDFLDIVSEHLKMLDCNCAHYECGRCKLTFRLRIDLLHHILLDHRRFYSPYSLHSDGHLAINCPQCAILGKLSIVNYYLFIKVLLRMEKCPEEKYTLLLEWCPPNVSLKNAIVCVNEESHAESQLSTCDRAGEVMCYTILQKAQSGKRTPRIKRKKSSESNDCICPLLKCPDCPKTTTNLGDLRKHVRLNNHNNWNSIRELWRKYKIIKENCPACEKFQYLDYILCPHCPHIHFDDEEAADTHMNLLHRGNVGKSAIKTDTGCTCAKQFLCMTCDKYFCTPQGLHHHMRRLGHETRANFDALPGMIKTRIKDKKKCPRCSLFISSKSQTVGSEEEPEECSCEWAVCNTCGNSYKKICVLLDHMRKMDHPVNIEYIEKERKKLISAFKGCQKCNNMEDRYCIFCNTRQNFIYHHMKTHHHDQQLMVLNGNNCELLDEYDLDNIERDIAKYECSVCLKRFLHSTTLRNHVRKVHPDCYFTLHCIDLSGDTLKMEDFASRKEIKVLAIVYTNEKNDGKMSK
nr:uncharacterized protein LOC123746407 [Procambarus clarkii]